MDSTSSLISAPVCLSAIHFFPQKALATVSNPKEVAESTSSPKIALSHWVMFGHRRIHFYTIPSDADGVRTVCIMLLSLLVELQYMSLCASVCAHAFVF